MGDPTTWVYQFIYDENDNVDTKIIQNYIMHGVGLCIKVYSYVTHMFYTFTFIHNTAVPIYINRTNPVFPLIQTLLYFLGELLMPLQIELKN